MRTKWERQVGKARNRILPMPKEFRLRSPRRRRKGRKEASIEESCRLVAKGMGWESRKMNGLGFRDWPDRLFLPPRAKPQKRRTFWVEFKRPGEEPTPSQWNRIKDLLARGEQVHVCDSVPQFRALMRLRHGA